MQRRVVPSDIYNIKSAQREDYNLNGYLNRKQSESNKITGVYVHEKCRKDYNNRKRISSLKPDSELKKQKIETINSTENFNSLLRGYYVERHAHRIRNTRKRSDCHYASTFEIRHTILRNCHQWREENRDDEWVLQVQRRVYSCIDFVAPEARYHAACYTRFSARKLSQETETRKTRRKKNEEMIMFFEQTCMRHENDISIR